MAFRERGRPSTHKYRPERYYMRGPGPKSRKRSDAKS